MHEESLTTGTQSVLEALNESGIVSDFYLAGGTALALYFGHRFSIDLDWFAEEFQNTSAFKFQLEKLGDLSIDSETKNTLNGSLDGVKISFFEYPYPLIAPKRECKQNVFLAGLADIAAMKLEAVSSRGSYKDFIDIYFLLENFSLEELLGFVKEKFSNLDYNEAHLLKAMTYFEDAKGTAMPEMIRQVSWQEVTETISTKVEQYLKSL